MSSAAANPPPYLSIAPARLDPIVLTCEHATYRLPRGVRAGRAEQPILRSHWGWDIGAWDLTRELATRLSTSAVGGRWSRLYVDLNRRIEDPTLARQEVEGVRISFNERLDAEELENRLRTIHAPYHTEIDRLVARRRIRDIAPLLFAVHSFTPVYDGRGREFEIGILYEHHDALARRLGRRIADSGLRVRYNEPYSGMAGMMYSADRHGQHHEVPCLELEVNQGMFDRRSTVPRLGRVVAAALRAIQPS